jgi:hypothetical protein
MPIELPYETVNNTMNMDYMLKNATSIECHNQYTLPCCLCNNQVQKLIRHYGKLICKECESKFIKKG